MQGGSISSGSAENSDKVAETPYHPIWADSLLSAILKQR